MNNTCKKSNQGGYTLLMMAMSMMVIGVLSVGALQVYNIYNVKQKLALNEKRVSDIIQKVQTFRQLYGRLPCPSSLNAARNSAAYGQETDCTDAVTIVTGTCTGGVCAVAGARPLVSPRVRIGAIPFRVLQADESDVTDAYNNRLLYAVTETLGVAATYVETSGSIDIRNENAASIINPVGSANFVILSAGENKMGAFSQDGVQSSPCTTGLPGAGLDSGNCIDLTAAPVIAAFTSSFTASAPGVTEFDDTIDYFVAMPESRWRRADVNKENIEAIVTNNVAAGVTTTPTAKLDIAQSAARAAGTGIQGTYDGALRATTNVQADKYCDDTGNNCFDVRDITGSLPQMTCSVAGQYVIGVEGDPLNPGHIRAKCAPVRVYCENAATPVFNGLNGAGQPICTAVTLNCGGQNVQVCNAAHTAFTPLNSNSGAITHPMTTPVGPFATGAVTSVTDTDSYAPNQKIAQFQCNNGVWIYTGSNSGMCSCNPTVPPASTCSAMTLAACSATVACPGVGVGTTGSAVQNLTYNAVSCAWVNSGAVDYSGCVCGTPPAAAGPTACPAGYNSGALIPGYTWNPAPSVCAYAAQASTCTCNAALSGPAPVGAPVACNTISGHAGETGWATPVYTFNSAAGTCAWYVSSWDTSGCTCDSTTEYVSALAHATTCTSCETQTVAAVWKYKYDGPGCSRGPDYMTTPPTCINKNFYWRLDGAGYSTFGAASKGGNPEVGNGCTCAQWGTSATSVCATAAPASTWNVGNCNCGL